MISYPYSYSENGTPIHIDKVNDTNRRDIHYYCFGCGQEMIPVLGNKKSHHFKHKCNEVCDPNRYLHELGKRIIKERFDNSESFIITYDAHQICSHYDECKMASKIWKRCKCDGPYNVDLKKFYDTCQLEKGYYEDIAGGKKRYVADVIFKSNERPDRRPVTIEIWVNHQCTEQKKRSGARIIEIKIEKEKDILRDIKEDRHGDLPIRFYGFQQEVHPDNSIRLRHFAIYNTTFPPAIFRDTQCYDGLAFDADADYEVIMEDGTKEVHRNLLSALMNQKSYPMRNCRMCSYLRFRAGTYCCDLKRRCRPCHYLFNPNAAKEIIDSSSDIIFWENVNTK